MVSNPKKQISSNWMKTHITEIAAYGGFAFCLILFTILTPMFGESIWSPTKLATLISDVIVLALASVGAVFIYALGCMDISIGTQVGLYATLMVIIGNATDSLIGGIAVSLALAVIIAAANGAAGELLNIVSVVSSPVIRMVLTGVNTITYNHLGSRNIALKTIDYHIFKSPWVMLSALVIEIIVVTYQIYF